jgi:hypothetical protein
MELFARPARIPGDRIGGYRNSRPRRIRVVGLGARGSAIARGLAARGHANVEIVTGARPIAWKDIVAEPPADRLNMLIVVCGEGDERLFGLLHGKPDMLVTFVVLKQNPAGSETNVGQIRGLSDLFVTTSDSDYVGDLVDNLAS